MSRPNFSSDVEDITRCDSVPVPWSIPDTLHTALPFFVLQNTGLPRILQWSLSQIHHWEYKAAKKYPSLIFILQMRKLRPKKD